MSEPWDAFVSYSTDASTPEAVALRHAVETFAKPWHRLRTCRVFLDDSSMPAVPGLWPTIERALSESRFMILLLSPAAAESGYVNREVAWWVKNKTADSILLVKCAGHVHWEDKDFAIETDCVPEALRGAFDDEPRWRDFSWFGQPGSLGAADPRFPEIVADLSAPIRSRERDELIGENVKQLRKARRFARGAVSMLVLLTVLSIVAATVAILQRDHIAQQAATLRARQLASVADLLASTDVQMSQLFAVASLRAQDNEPARSALLRATVNSPALQQFETLPAGIRALQVGPDGRALAVGLANGAVYGLNSYRRGSPTLLFDLGKPVISLSLSTDGTTVAAVGSESLVPEIGESSVMYWRDGRVSTLSVPADLSAQGVAVSPNGSILVVNGEYGEPLKFGSPGLDFFDAATGIRTRRIPDPHSRQVGDLSLATSEATFIDDDRITLVDSFQDWAVMRIADGKVLHKGATAWVSDGGASVEGSTTFVSSGQWYVHSSASQGNSVGVWSTLAEGPRGPDPRAPLNATIQYASPQAVNVTRDGRWVVLSDATGLLVGQARHASETSESELIRLTGSRVASHVAFLDSPTRLVSASGDTLAFWDTQSPGRLARSSPLAPQQPDIVYGADLNEVRMALSPDGNSYALVNLHSGVVERGSLPGRVGVPTSRVELTFNDLPLLSSKALYWMDNARVALLSSDSPVGAPGWLQAVAIPPPTEVLNINPDRTRVVVLSRTDDEWAIDRYELPSGQRLSRVPLHMPENSIVVSATGSTDGTVVGYLVLPFYDNRDLQPKLTFIDSATGSIQHEQTLSRAIPNLVLAIDGRDAVVQFGSEHAELWRNFGRDGRESFGADLLPRAPASEQSNPPLFSPSLIALTTKSGTALYSRNGADEIASLPVPIDRAGHPRVTMFDVEGRSMLTAYLGPTEESALLTALPLDSGTQRERACATSGRQLTVAEWTHFVGSEAQLDVACQ